MQRDELTEILGELRSREPIFHRREFGTSRRDLEAMTEAGFWEIGASGAVYDREEVIRILLERYQTPESERLRCRDFSIRQLSGDLYQLNYLFEELARITRRTTLWRKTVEGWKIVFNQGTVCESAGS
jgi:hypothetical protein